MLQVKHGSIYTSDGSFCISSPAVMFDRVTGCLHKWGNQDIVQSTCDEWMKRDTSGLVTNDLVVLAFDLGKMPAEEVCKIMNKMIDCTGYCKVFYDRIVSEQNGFVGENAVRDSLESKIVDAASKSGGGRDKDKAVNGPER